MKTPIQVLVNEFFQPAVNFAINDIIIPDFLNNGLLEVGVYDSNNKLYDTVVVDATLPQNPNFFNHTMDVFADGALYFKSKGKRLPRPTTPMRFQLDEQNLQFVLSSYSLNQLLETILSTETIVIPINHHTVEELSGFELTTTLLLPIIPELFYNYGSRNLSLALKPLSGTTVSWASSAKETLTHIEILSTWYVHDDATDTKTELVFESILSLDVSLYLDINDTKHVNLKFDKMALSGFNVTLDNLGGSIKSDEANILFRLGGVVSVVEAAINTIIAAIPIQLPELSVVDYSIKFDY